MKKILFALVVALSTLTAAQAQTKVAHVKSQQLLDTMPSRKAGIKEIQALEASGIKELREMDSAVRMVYMAYEDKVKKGIITSDAAKQIEMARIQRMQDNLEARQQEIDQQLQYLTQDLNNRTIERVKKAVNIVATKKGIQYVIDGDAALFAGGTDITNEVIVELMKLEAGTTSPSGTGTAPK